MRSGLSLEIALCVTEYAQFGDRSGLVGAEDLTCGRGNTLCGGLEQWHHLVGSPSGANDSSDVKRFTYWSWRHANTCRSLEHRENHNGSSCKCYAQRGGLATAQALRDGTVHARVTRKF